jgi:hypothetical protein
MNTFKAVFSGFKSIEQASCFLDWYEGQGEQDETIGEWLGDENLRANCNVVKGKIFRDDEVEYELVIR